MSAQPKAQPRRSREETKLHRRQQLVDATIDCIARLGFAETTVARVAETAGLSQGIVIFHFKSKEQLLVEALRHLAEEYQQTWRQAMARAGGEDAPALDRICALVAADFAPALCSRKKVAVWHAFWGESKARPVYRQICGERDDDRFREMESACEDLRPGQGWQLAAMIDSLSDGFWQRMHLDPGSYDRAGVLSLMGRQLLALFPEHEAALRQRLDLS